MDQETKRLWDLCTRFHGHECGGVAVGFQAARYARELLEIKTRAADEEIVCVAENDACGVDAIQVILGCTVGKGNLIFDLQGKLAYSFYRRDTGKSLRLVLRSTPGLSKEQRRHWLMEGDYHEMFDVKEVPYPVPEPARIFKNVTCSVCGERMAETHAHLQNGALVCDRCLRPYTRRF